MSKINRKCLVTPNARASKRYPDHFPKGAIFKCDAKGTYRTAGRLELNFSRGGGDAYVVLYSPKCDVGGELL